MALTSEEFIAALKRRIIYPANQELLTQDALLEVVSGLLRTKMTKIVKASRQNYLLTTSVIPLVSNQAFYDVPYRAVVNGLEDVKYLLTDNITLRDLSYITVEDLEMFVSGSSYPQAFYFQSDQIGVVPTPLSESGSLKVWWHRRLSKLCLPADAGQVTNIAGDIVTIDNAPTTFMAGTLIDFIKSAGLPVILEQDVEITNVAGTQITFATDEVPSRLVVGDWIAPAGFTPIIPLMDEAFEYFEGICGAHILDTIGDYEGSARLMEEARSDEKDFMSVLEPRIDGEPEKIVNYHNLLRQRSWRPFGMFRR
jgi:hypothetical protein